MKPGAGKRKGSKFEREVARRLSKWLTGGRDSKQLIRSVLSGGWDAGKEDGFRQVGDLAPNGPFGEAFRQVFAVECKHQREIDLYQVWSRKNAKLVQWWKKLCEEVGTSKGVEEPMLVFRSNNRPDIVGLRTRYVQELSLPVDFPAVAIWRIGLTLFPFEQLLELPVTWFVKEMPNAA